eukprot:m.8327 g.8327  ORF g.8327 m.8327 type:complete len:387 (+) comp3872_c0_seq1:225-1385(+)
MTAYVQSTPVLKWPRSPTSVSCPVWIPSQASKAKSTAKPMKSKCPWGPDAGSEPNEVPDTRQVMTVMETKARVPILVLDENSDSKMSIQTSKRKSNKRAHSQPLSELGATLNVQENPQSLKSRPRGRSRTFGGASSSRRRGNRYYNSSHSRVNSRSNSPCRNGLHDGWSCRRQGEAYTCMKDGRSCSSAGEGTRTSVDSNVCFSDSSDVEDHLKKSRRQENDCINIGDVKTCDSHKTYEEKSLWDELWEGLDPDSVEYYYFEEIPLDDPKLETTDGLLSTPSSPSIPFPTGTNEENYFSECYLGDVSEDDDLDLDLATMDLDFTDEDNEQDCDDEDPLVVELPRELDFEVSLEEVLSSSPKANKGCISPLSKRSVRHFFREITTSG